MAARYRVMVVDDDAGVRDLLRAQLNAAGLEVSLAYNGEEVAAELARSHPDLVILDINMPKLDGFGVLQSLRPILENRRIPVLVLTARHAPEDIKRALSLGAKDYLTKPFNNQQLMTRVGRLLRLSGGPLKA